MQAFTSSLKGSQCSPRNPRLQRSSPVASASSESSSSGSSESNLALSFAGVCVNAIQTCGVMCTLDMLLRCVVCQTFSSAFAARALANWLPTMSCMHIPELDLFPDKMSASLVALLFLMSPMQIALHHVTDTVSHYPAQVLRPCLLPARLPDWRPPSSTQAWRTTPAPMGSQRASSGSLEPLSSPSLLHYGPSRCCCLQKPSTLAIS